MLSTSNSRAKTKALSGMRLMKYKKYVAGFSFFTPFFLLFSVFFIFPIIWGFIVSLTNYDIINPMRWTGLSNYVNLITNDNLFVVALQNTLYFAMISGPIGFICSYFFAWVINQLKFKDVFSLAFYAPSIMSVLAVSVVWLSLFAPNRVGYVNDFLIRLGLITEPIGWNIDPQYIMPLIIAVAVWQSLGAGFLTNLAGFANINPEIYEAGKIDGIRNRFQELFLLTIPQMKPQLLFNAIMAIVYALNEYFLVSMIAGFPSPDNAALTLVLHMFDYGFQRLELGYATAISFVVLIISYVLGQVVMKVLAEKD